MYVMDNFFGMPWNELFELMELSIGLLFSKYLFMTIVVYIMFVAVIAISDLLDMLVPYLFYFTCIFLLFAKPISDLFAWIDWFLKEAGINLPSFFA